jgi:hypothetical protein
MVRTSIFVYHLKASTQRVSVALRRATSDAVLVFNQVAKAYPAVPLGGVAAAPLEGAAEDAEGNDEEEDEEAERGGGVVGPSALPCQIVSSSSDCYVSRSSKSSLQFRPSARATSPAAPCVSV